jgi:hypothetical protein
MKIRLALLAVALATAPAAADIQYVDNSAGQFVWDSSYDFNGEFFHGTSLDISLDASQPGDSSVRSFMSYSETFFTSNQLVTVSMRADLPGDVKVARGDDLFLDFGPWSDTVSPPIVFSPGALIGPGAGGGAWYDDADINYRSGQNTGSLIGGRGIVGIRLELPDGIHYGWIDLQDNGYHGEPELVPLAWAWETTPGVPIPAGLVPAPAGAGVLAMLLIASSRRRRAR